MPKAEYYPGHTYPIALRMRNGRLEVVKPSLRVVGWGGYETWYYPDDVHVIVYLEFLMSVGRQVLVPFCTLPYGWHCKDVRKLAEKLWVEEGKDEKEVEAALGSLVFY